MLAKKNRLNLSQESRRELFRNGQRYQTKELVFLYDNLGDLLPQVAVIIPKKIIDKATDRNALRRKIFNSVQPFLEKNPSLRLIIRVVNERAMGLSVLKLTEILKVFFSQPN